MAPVFRIPQRAMVAYRSPAIVLAQALVEEEDVSREGDVLLRHALQFARPVAAHLRTAFGRDHEA